MSTLWASDWPRAPNNGQSDRLKDTGVPVIGPLQTIPAPVTLGDGRERQPCWEMERKTRQSKQWETVRLADV